MSDSEQQEFDRFQPIVRARAQKDYGCLCAWCCYRTYNLLTGHADPGLPGNDVAAEMLHQGPALVAS